MNRIIFTLTFTMMAWGLGAYVYEPPSDSVPPAAPQNLSVVLILEN